MDTAMDLSSVAATSADSFTSPAIEEDSSLCYAMFDRFFTIFVFMCCVNCKYVNVSIGVVGPAVLPAAVAVAAALPR